MKKKIAICGLVIISVLFLWDIQDYYVVGDLGMTSTNHTVVEIELDVIVYQPWKAKKIASEIAHRYTQLNGEPSTLTIRMYHSLTGRSHGKKAFKIVSFAYK